jgi:hypothetical protein
VCRVDIQAFIIGDGGWAADGVVGAADVENRTTDVFDVALR